MFVSADDRNSSQNIIQVQQAGITLSNRDYYFRNETDKVLVAYKEFMVKIGTLLGGEMNSTEEQMREIFQFEKKLAEIYEPKERLRNMEKIYHKMTVADLQQLAPAISWLDYMNTMFSSPVTHEELVIVYTPEYLKNMSNLVIMTDRRILANYMVWHLIKPLVDELSKPFRDASLELMKAEKGVEGNAPQWKTCVVKTDAVMGFATGYLYIKERSGKISKKEAEDMIAEIKKAFIGNLPHVNWMDEETKTQALKKVSSTFDMIGYPTWVEDLDALDKYYENLTIGPANSFENYLEARRFFHNKSMNRRGKTINRKDWWNNQSVEAFQQHALCMVDQYGHFSVAGRKVNGKQTLSENIADNGGLKLAYSAYQGWIQMNGRELKLPGLDFTPEQLFFLGFAQVQQAGITLSNRDYYFRNETDKVLVAYKEFMVKIGTLLGGEMNSTEEQMREIFQFEKKLAEIYEPKERLRNMEKIYHKMTVADLQQLAPAISWLDYMNTMFSSPVTHEELVVVYTPEYLKNMSNLVIMTDRRILANYMVWHLIKPLVDELSKPFRDASLELMKAEKGVEGKAPQWKTCVVKTDAVMGFATAFFPNIGRLFDEHGNLASWWNNQSVEAFQQHALCMVDQYGHFSVAGMKVNGKQTLSENIADNGGLKLAYSAYQGWIQMNGRELKLPGLDFTPEQLFFLGFAQVSPDLLPDLLFSCRVLAAVSNSDEFAAAFQCPVNSTMNPVHKCQVW
ncbi:PREDICTED: endothelin-converting enzyme 1-like [Acropora digitifera]|uniref:endothelin-converting enzyme 1-like n=1 Tax=Acropora digitifera TaxID=70779 RepID=UPI00077A38BF|nr:PREDICTED: endothelin-converting enzyme 1-like [Acropora digitifera]